MKRILVSLFFTTILIMLLTSCSTQVSTVRVNETPIAEALVENAYVEIPNVRVVENPIQVPFSNIMDQTITFYAGQGSASFNLMTAEVKDEVIVYAKNNGKKDISYTLKSPTETVWYSTTLNPGESVTTEQVIQNEQAGDWSMDFTTVDGSAGSVTVSARNAENVP